MTEPQNTEAREERTIYDPLTDTPTSYAREPAGTHPPLDYEPYKSTALRHPKQPLVYLPQTISEITGPQLAGLVHEGDNDLTIQHGGAPIGERIIVSGRVFDTEGKPLRDTLVEIWQANAAGRYRHKWDRWPAELDPNFWGAGRCLTDRDGRYTFTTIKPGPYPWGNHHNAWRPAHIHFSLLGRAFAQRLVTQMYFPGDPLFTYDPIFNSVADPRVRRRLVSRFSMHDTVPNWALHYEFDIYLRGPGQTPFEDAH
jgi:protocatechuate 3,4-dioxygenase, beta subunit